MTENSLEAILSPDRGETAAPAVVTPEPAPSEALPSTVEPSPAAADDAAATTVADPSAAPSAPPAGFVPHQALAEARAREREAKEHNAAMQRQIDALMRAIPQQKPEPPPAAPDPWVDPTGAARYEARQELSPELRRIEQTTNYNSMLVAAQLYGQDKVREAETAFEQAVRSGAVDPRGPEAQRIFNSPNMYEETVKWHRRTTALATYGDDPTAFEAQVREKVLAEIRASGQVPPAPAPNGAAGAPVLPSNIADARSAGARGGPAWSGPPSMTDIFKR